MGNEKTSSAEIRILDRRKGVHIEKLYVGLKPRHVATYSENPRQGENSGTTYWANGEVLGPGNLLQEALRIEQQSSGTHSARYLRVVSKLAMILFGSAREWFR